MEKYKEIESEYNKKIKEKNKKILELKENILKNEDLELIKIDNKSVIKIRLC